MRVAISILSAVCGYLSLLNVSSAQTVQSVLRALQQRRVALEWQESYVDPEKTTLSTITWRHFENSPYPQDDEPITLDNAIDVLNQASIEFDLMKGKFVAYDVDKGEFVNVQGYSYGDSARLKFSYLDLPSVGTFDAENWRRKIKVLASSINHLRCLEWAYELQKGVISFHHPPVPGQPDEPGVPRNHEGATAWTVAFPGFVAPASIQNYILEDAKVYPSEAPSYWEFGPKPALLWQVDGYASVYDPPGDAAGSQEFVGNFTLDGITAARATAQPARPLTSPPSIPNMSGSVNFFKSPWVMDGGDLTEAYTKNHPSNPDNPAEQLRLGVMERISENGVVGQFTVTQNGQAAVKGRELFLEEVLEWLKLPRPQITGNLVASPPTYVPPIEDVTQVSFALSPSASKPRYYNERSSWHALGVDLHCIVAWNFTPISLTYEYDGEHSLPGAVELSVRNYEIARISVGRGIDGYQTGALVPRLDSFGSLRFAGAPTAFELLYEYDYKKFTDVPLGGSVPSPKFEAPVDFTQEQKDGSAWKSRFDYNSHWFAPRLTQVKGRDVLVTISYPTCYRKVLNFYWAADSGVIENGFYQPTAAPFKTVIISNPTAPLVGPGLPTDPVHLRISDNDERFYNCWLSGALIENGEVKWLVADPVFTFTCDKTQEGDYWKQVITAKPTWVGPWEVSTRTGADTVSSKLTWHVSPIESERPQLSLLDINNGSRKIDFEWNPGPDQAKKVLTRATYSGSDNSWLAKGREVTWDIKGWLVGIKDVFEGREFKVSESVSGNSWYRSLLLDGKSYTGVTAQHSPGFSTVNLSIGGQPAGEVQYVRHQRRLAIYPGGYRESWGVGTVDGYPVYYYQSGWGEQFKSGMSSKIGVSLRGDIREMELANSGLVLRRDVGSNFTGWGAPRTVTGLRGEVSSRSYYESGANWGLPLSVKGPEGVSRGVTGYDWLSRATGVAEGHVTTALNYGTHRKVIGTSDIGDAEWTLNSYGETTGFTENVTSLGSMSWIPGGNSSVQLHGKNKALTVDAMGMLRGMSEGLGSRASEINYGVDLDMLYIEETTSPKSNSAAGVLPVVVRTYYDAFGRIKKRRRPAANNATVTEEWVYNDAARTVVHNPGVGPVARSMTSTISADGATVTMKAGNVELARLSRKVENNQLITITEKTGDSASVLWEEVSRVALNPAAGTAVFTPWGIGANSVTLTQSVPDKVTKLSLAGNGDSLTVTLDGGLPREVDGTIRGVSMKISSMTHSHGRLTELGGKVADQSVGLRFGADRRLSLLTGPHTNRSFGYGGGQGSSVTSTDSESGVISSAASDPSGDLTSFDDGRSLGLNFKTLDTADGSETTLKVEDGGATNNRYVTVATNLLGDVSRRTYSGGITDFYELNSDGTLASHITQSPQGSRSVTIQQSPNQRIFSYSDGVVVQEGFYNDGLRSSVTAPADGRAFTYNKGALRSEQHTSGPWRGWKVERVPDARGRIEFLRITEDGGNTIQQQFGYDSFSRLASTNSSGMTAEYGERHATGALSSVTRGPVTSSWSRDDAGRLTGFSSTVGQGGTSYSYSFGTLDLRGRITKRQATIGRSWNNLSYDGRDQLRSVDIVQLGALARSLAYDYDTRGNRSGQGAAVSQTPNALDQIGSRSNHQRGFGITGTINPGAQVRVFYPSAPSGGDTLQVQQNGAFHGFWSLDSSWGGGGGGIVSALIRGTLPNAGANGTDAVAEKEFRLAIPPAQESLGYDPVGNLSSDGFWELSWNAGRLIQMTRKPEALAEPGLESDILQFVYDADGRRTQKFRTRTYNDDRETVEESRVLWSGWLPVLEERFRDGLSLGRRFFVWGADVSGSFEGAGGIGGLLAIREEDLTGKVMRTLLPVQDGLGNITAVLNAADGSVVAQYDVGPFGEPLGEYGEVDACPFRFQSKWWDAETELSYFGYRYYSPRLGRWLSRDPLGEAGGINLYAYCGNDPVNRWDYLGMASKSLAEVLQDQTVTMPEVLDLVLTPKEATGILEAFGKAPAITTPSTVRSQITNSRWEELQKLYPALTEYTLLNAESRRINQFRAKLELVRHSELIQKQLRVYDAMLDLTVVTATIPFQTPSVSGLPWVGRNISPPVGNGMLTPMNPIGSMKGPVKLTFPPNATPAEMAEVHAYVQAANHAVRTGDLSPIGRVSTAGSLRAASSQAAAAERQAAMTMGDPYFGVVGHAPDTTWLGRPMPPIWLDQTWRVNSSIGAQALRYPIGYRPTGFTVGD